MFLQAVVLGLVEGLTEFLPVSSTGHLLIAEHLLGTRPSEAFNILVQVGPILASAFVFRGRVLGWFRGRRDPAVRSELLAVMLAFLVTGFGGLVLKKLHLELPEEIAPVAWATLLGVPVILGVERFARRRPGRDTVGWKVALVVAAAQLLAAAFPGTSRSGACVMAALALGVARPAAVEFAFLVGIPTMLAAGAHGILGAWREGSGSDLLSPFALVAFATATLSAWGAVAWLLRWVRSRDFVPFAWYRLALGLALLGWTFLG